MSNDVKRVNIAYGYFFGSEEEIRGMRGKEAFILAYIYLNSLKVCKYYFSNLRFKKEKIHISNKQIETMHNKDHG